MFVVDDRTLARLKELSEETTMSQSLIVRLGVNEFYKAYQRLNNNRYKYAGDNQETTRAD